MDTITKNLLIKSSSETIRSFKELGVKFFRKYDKIYLFSYKNFLTNILLNMEIEYVKKYNSVTEPTVEYLVFYKRKGTILVKAKQHTQANIGFTLDAKYYYLYYSLMHTFYINECQHLSNYSVSIFFKEVVNYSEQNDLQLLFPTIVQKSV